MTDEEDISGYQEALEAAGVTVHAFEQFGSYQGDWIAHVTYGKQTGYIFGSFGSCSGCDAFQAEFGSRWKDPATDAQLAAFAAEYLDAIVPFANALVTASVNLSWDFEAKAMVAWVEAQEDRGNR